MSGGLSAGVAILKASWASLKMSEEEWMFFWMASSTVRNLSMSPADRRETPPVDTRVGGGGSRFQKSAWRCRAVLPLAAVSMVEASSHCCDSRCPSVNQRGYLLGTMEMPW